MMPKVEQFYQHRHGGLYFVESVATHTTSKERLVVYSHLYPFDVETYARPISEWTEERFREVTHGTAMDLMNRNEEQFREEILESKKKSQAAESKS